MTRNLLEQLDSIARPLARSLGLELWGLELSSGPRQILRVFLDREQEQGAEQRPSAPAGSADAATVGVESGFSDAGPRSVSVDECASFSRLFGIALDVEDIMPGAYVLEVSSPGFERSFFTAAQLAGAVGRLLDVTFLEAPEGGGGRKKFRGRLVAGPLPEKTLGPDARFALRLAEEGEEGEERENGGEDLVFSFGDLRKARQVWIMPEKTRPGKGGKKNKENAAPRKGGKHTASAPGGADES